MRSAFVSFAVAIAVVAVVAVMGAGLISVEGWRSNGGRGSIPPAPASPSPYVTMSPAPSPEILPSGSDYSIGRHSLTADGVYISFDIPKYRWEPYGTLLISKSERGPQGAEGLIYWTAYPEGQDASACGPWVNNTDTADLDVVAERIATAPGVRVTEPPSDVTVGGVPAKHLVVTVTEDRGCDPGYFFSWKAKTGGALWVKAAVGDNLRMWFMNVQDKIFFIVAQTNAEATYALGAEMEQIVGSIGFE